VPRGLRSYHCGMPGQTVSYHWAFAPNTVINPHTYVEGHCDINLPEKHTLRRILLSEPRLFWKRGSVSNDQQEMYFLHYEVQYGAQEGAPILYRTTRTLRQVVTVNPTGVTEVFKGFHCGADLELGMNERVQRGGFYSFAQRLRLAWSISSSGGGDEELSGQANVPFRALYSLPVLP
jgi:hypothetical protein